MLRAIGGILEWSRARSTEPARYGGEEFVIALPETGSEGAVDATDLI